MADAPPLAELVGVTKRFGGVTVVDDLSLTIAGERALGVIGPNGAGKTTMLHLLAGDLRPDRGTVRLDGHDVTRLRADRRCRAGIGRTAQVPRPYGGMSVFENVLVAAVFGGATRKRERAATPAAVAALDRTGLLPRADRMAGTLPLLDRKRLELARALASGPRLLLLDEIAGGLTDAETEELVGTIRALRGEGLGVVWIEHIVHALLAVVDRLVVIDHGRVVADGDPREVVDSPAVHQIYLGDTAVVGP